MFSNAASVMCWGIGEIAASNSNSNRITITTLQRSLANGSSKVGFIWTGDLPLKSDDIHFGRNAKLTIVERFADVFIGTKVGIGDVTGDAMINLADWVEFNSHFRLDTSALADIERLQVGDFDGSSVVGIKDFVAFRNLHDEANGSGALAAALSSVPEPCTLTMLLIGASMMSRRAPLRRLCRC